MRALGAAVLAGPPVELTREQAAALARDELADPAYHAADQPLLLRALEWVVTRLQELLDRIGTSTPGGWYGVLGLLVVVVAVVTVVRWQMGPVRRTGSADPLFDLAAGQADAAEHRRRARAAEHRGAYDEAVREWLRAVVRELEERGVLEPRPGRTADEAAHAAGFALPGLAGDLRAATRRFDEVAYGGRVAGPVDSTAMADLDAAVRAARPVPARVDRSGTPAVPR